MNIRNIQDVSVLGNFEEVTHYGFGPDVRSVLSVQVHVVKGVTTCSLFKIAFGRFSVLVCSNVGYM